MNKKVLLSLFLSTSIMIGSTLPALAVTNPESQIPKSTIGARNLEPYYAREQLYALGYPLDGVMYDCDNIIRDFSSTRYIITLTINGRNLIGERLVLETSSHFKSFTRGISAEKVTQLKSMTDNDWNSLKKLSTSDEKYAVRNSLYYSHNLYVEESNVTELSQCIALVQGEYVPCTKYKLLHQASGQEFEIIVDCVNGTIVSGAKLI